MNIITSSSDLTCPEEKSKCQAERKLDFERSEMASWNGTKEKQRKKGDLICSMSFCFDKCHHHNFNTEKMARKAMTWSVVILKQKVSQDYVHT